MAGKRGSDALARERSRRLRGDEAQSTRTTGADIAAPPTRREAAQTCAWCGASVMVKQVGRIPKWCSHACRQRAWEQSRAAASGRSAIEIVERVVTAPTPHSKEKRTPTHGDWAPLLHELAGQLNAGRIYRRDLPGLAAELVEVLAAVERQQVAKAVRR